MKKRNRITQVETITIDESSGDLFHGNATHNKEFSFSDVTVALQQLKILFRYLTFLVGWKTQRFEDSYNG